MCILGVPGKLPTPLTEMGQEEGWMNWFGGAELLGWKLCECMYGIRKKYMGDQL